MPFYEYRQNNSGGGFDIDIRNGITVLVIVEAKDAAHADSIAEGIGIYFDGVGEEDEDGSTSGQDCPCCGDRWYGAYGDGDPVPMQYGVPVGIDYAPDEEYKIRYSPEEDPDIIVHYLDGRIIGFDPHVIIRDVHVIQESPL